MKRTVVAGLVCALGLSSGCSSPSTSASGAPDESTLGSSQLALPTPVAVPSSGEPVSGGGASASASDNYIHPDFKTWTISGVNKEDVPFKAIVHLDPSIRHAEEVVDTANYGPLMDACGAPDPKRDAVMLASVEMLAVNNGFDTSTAIGVSFVSDSGLAAEPVSLQLEKWAPSSVQFAVGYTEPECMDTYQNQLAFGVNANIHASPDGAAESGWGPGLVLLVLRGFYGPSHPDSNPQLQEYLAHASFLASTVATTSNPSGVGVYDIPRAKDVDGPGRKKSFMGPYFQLATA